MHPDRRRAGRAIRRQRRLERESYLAQKDREFEYIVSGQFARDVKVLVDAAAAGWAAFGAAVSEALKAFRALGETPLERNRLALPPAPDVLRRFEVGSPYPTQSGVQRGREAYSASGSQGPDVPYAWLDEQVDFGGWEDR